MVDSGESVIAMQQSKKESRAVRTERRHAKTTRHFFNLHSGQVIVQEGHVSRRVHIIGR